MANFNKVFLMGNLTRDPQLSYLPSQMAVVDFGLAVNRRWMGKDGERKEDTCFVDCRAFGRSAENINKYLSKGSPLFVEGRLDFDSWTAQDGTKRTKHRVTVENFQFLGGQGEKSRSATAPSRQNFGAEQKEQVPEATGGVAEQGEDDIPF
jgi:single-strand DNA-binding protein